MKIQIQKSLLQQMIGHRNGYLVLACGSLLLNILLGVGMIMTAGHEKIILCQFASKIDPLVASKIDPPPAVKYLQ